MTATSRWNPSTMFPMAPAPRRAPSATCAACSKLSTIRRLDPTVRIRFSIKEISFFEREVRLRLPFRFGVVTLTSAPQAFVRARIALEDGKEDEGAAAEMLVPNWIDNYGPQIALGATQGMNSLTACFGPALIDRALLDALCRALGVSFYEAVRSNLPGISAPGWQADLAGFDMDEFLSQLSPATQIAARHTVGLLDPVTPADKKVNDGLPETLGEVVARYGHRWFKLKVGGDAKADVERLLAIAAVLDRNEEPYQATLDGNEQYASAAGALELWRRIRAEPRLKRLASSIAFIEQPVNRQHALSGDVSALAEEKPVIIDESDDSLEAFPRARRLGYTGVSSKTCKCLYKSLLNAARCRLWNREEGAARYFMSGEDLKLQAGLALQQDLALVSLLGLTHVERNGHHYVDGMAALPSTEQAAFLEAHPDLYEVSHGAVRLKIRDGDLQIGSLGCPGFASAAMPGWKAMRSMP